MKATPEKSSAVAAARAAATRQAPHADVSHADVRHADVSGSLSDTLSDTGTTAPAVSPTGPGLDVRSVRRLQAGAGNAAVARLVAQRYAEVVKPPPSQAPGFRRVQSDVAAKKAKLKQHKSAAVESRSAQDAAVAPPDDRQAQGKAANAEKMNEAKPGEFDKNAFIGAVNEAIAAQAPKNLEEADGFADSGRADSIKDSVDGKVKDGKESSAEEIETATTAAPDTSRAKEKQVTPMSADQPPGNPGAPSTADAVPARQPDEVLDFSEGPRQVDQQMADAEVTEEQLARGNEPQFDRALAEKKKGEQHTAAAPAKGRAAEAKQLSAAQAGAAVSGAQAMNAMTADRGAAGRAVDSGKGETKSADEKKREQVTARLQKVFDATQKDVEKILGDLDGKVDRQFTEGEKRARDDFTADHKRRMREYKDRRYSGWRGPFRWGRDKLKGLPQEGLDIFKKSRELYVTKMQAVISTIADTIGTELGRAKARIATGRNELKAEVDRLPADLRQFGEEAAADFAGKFDDLESQVNDKSQELVQTLAQKYTEALNSVDEEIKKLEEENKGLIAMVVDAVVGVIQTIMELKNLLMGILAKAASAITKIIKDPIGFLRNLVSSVGAGLNLFIGNIADHLKSGLVSWLLGTAVSTGLAIPSRFDLKGIIQLIASLLGLTWDNIRARITRKGVPEQAMAKVEQSVPVAGALAREGPAGAAQEITAETGDLKTTILDDLKSYLIPTVLIAGITWILSLLNPASAFIRAVKAIIDIVTFIVTQGAQIAAFVNAVLDAVIAIANGAQAGVPKAIETALATSIPLLIGLLASLLGIGGLANKVRQVFQKVSRPVNRAIDKLVDKIAKAGKRLWSDLRKRSGSKRKESPEKQDREKGKRKDREIPEALSRARQIVDSSESAGAAPADLLTSLNPLRMRFPWIRGFEFHGSYPYSVFLLASRHRIGNFSQAEIKRVKSAHQRAEKSYKSARKLYQQSRTKNALAQAGETERAGIVKSYREISGKFHAGRYPELDYQNILRDVKTARFPVADLIDAYDATVILAKDLERSLQMLRQKTPPAVGDVVVIVVNKVRIPSAVTAVGQSDFTSQELSDYRDDGKAGPPVDYPISGKWSTFVPDRGFFKRGPAWEEMKKRDSWAEYRDARQVLSYRAGADERYPAVPKGKNWHHIREANNGGLNTVKNLGLVDKKINQDVFNRWFESPQPGTGNTPVRDYLADQPDEVHMSFGMDCIHAHGLSLKMKNTGRGNYQEIE